MAGVGWFYALPILLIQAVDISLAYNMDVSPERILTINGSRYFGYRVRQIRSTNGDRILAADPYLGQLHSCDVIGGNCDIISLPGKLRDHHIGLTLEVEPKSGRSIVCGSDTPHDCGQTLYMNGLCFTMDSSLTTSPKLNPGYQECQKADVDLCILFDGSGSSGQPELLSIKHFLKSAVRNLRNTSVNLAIAQFSSQSRTELDFRQYQKFKNLIELIDKLTLLDQATKTFHGINHTLNNIFTEKAGNRPHAKKVLLVLTDGDANDVNNAKEVIDRANQLGVKRYLIGIGNNFNNSESTKKTMKEIASDPTDTHTRVLNNFKELEDLFEEMQRKILAIEGVQACLAASGGSCNAQDTDFSREFSSAGLSAALTQDKLLLGDPGVFSWSGGLLDISGPEKLINISLQKEDKYGYLGYSVEVLRAPNGIFYVLGAPRYQYVGLVTIFQETPEETERIQNISGEQVGSYFGSEIEVCDTDQDGFSDLVLIAAPHFYHVRWSGQVSVYRYIQGHLQFQVSLHGELGHLHSQFGAALSCLGDVNGDGFSDVAVGAPYEGRGALYIFRGEAGGVQAAYSQRLTAPAGTSGFGLSVDGWLDMTGDGLTDVAVGAVGSVTLCRSQPLLNVSVTVTSIPPEIPIPTVESATCDIEVTLQMCVDPEILTKQYTGPLNVSLQYAVILDSVRSVSRMSFNNNRREMKQYVVLRGPERLCWNHSIALVDCFMEDSSPVWVSLVAAQVPDVSPWLLSSASSLSDSTQIPFQLCGSGGSCEPDFHLDLRTEHLVVEEGASFSVFLKLKNKGENAQGVQLIAPYAAGLSYRKVNITEASRRISILCEDSESKILVCNVSHPIMRRASWADIHIMFGIISNVSWPDRIPLTVQVTSNNNGNVTSVTQHIPVLYPINIISRRVENSTKYLQFIEHKQQSKVIHAYQIQNLGAGPALSEFSVTVTTPARETGDLIWDYRMNSLVSHGNCTQLDHSQPGGHKVFLCKVEQHGTINIHVTGVLSPKHAWRETKSVELSTAVTIGYNETRYHSYLGAKFHHVQVTTQVNLLVLPNHVWYYVGSTAGGVILLLLICGLLYKIGFFKRFRDRTEENPASTDAQQEMSDGVKAEETTEGPLEPLMSPPEPVDPQ